MTDNKLREEMTEKYWDEQILRDELYAREHEVAELNEKLRVAVEALEELNIPYQVFSPKKMPRFPDEIIKDALAKIKGGSE